MITFDQASESLTQVFADHAEALERVAPLLVNRDLNGRMRLIAEERVHDDDATRQAMKELTQALAETLGPHGFAAERGVIFEASLDEVPTSGPCYPLEGVPGVRLIDRLTTDGQWAHIAPMHDGAPRVVFFSIKGGVGRSTALAATAWALAQQGQRVLVLDLDLESPGLSSSLLPEDRRPTFGIADWLVEDLVDNGDAVIDQMTATSLLARDGEIFVVPAHGAAPGDYVAKLGRVWMPKVAANGSREGWTQRLNRLLSTLEDRVQPDIVLIDSRAGIDEVASACVTGLGAKLVLLFALDGEQTWSGYRILFRYWHLTGVVRNIRERLQLVGAMVPETDAQAYFEGLLERGWQAFADDYDELPPPDQASGDEWNFGALDESAPHYPWAIKWQRSFAALRSLHARLDTVDAQEVSTIFGPVIDGISQLALTKADSDV